MLAMLMVQVFNSSRADLARGIYMATFAPDPLKVIDIGDRELVNFLITFSEGKACDIVYIHTHVLIRDGK